MRNWRLIASRCLCWILAIQLLNLSVDPPDLRSFAPVRPGAAASIGVNDLESVYEWVAEGVFGQDVPEGDEEDIEKRFPPFQLIACRQPALQLAPLPAVPAVHRDRYRASLPDRVSEPTAPPPKAA